MIKDDSPCSILATWPVKLIDVPEPALPPAELRLKAFTFFPPERTKVIILGQDPYPSAGKANGLSFGIHKDWRGTVFQSSFGNLFEEVVRWCPLDYQPLPLNDWCTLEGWARQGVLLTNTRLSLEEGKPMSHAGLGWEQYVGLAVQAAISASDPILVAFGSEARLFYEKQLKFCGRSAEEYRDGGRLLCYSHPCRYSASRSTKHSKRFIGSNCFSEINSSLMKHGHKPVNWWET